MIEERKRWGEPITDESWLFRSYADGGKGGKLSKIARNEPAKDAITVYGISMIVCNVTKAVGFYKKEGKRRLIHNHTFRRSFETALDDKLSPALLNFIMGGAIPLEVASGVPTEKRGAYKIYKPEYVRKQWIKHDCDMALNLGTSKEIVEACKIIDMMKTAGMTQDEIDKMYELLRAFKRPEDELTELRKKSDELIRLRLFGGGIGAKPKLQKIVDETELQDHLEQGFEISAVLPSGKIVAKK